MVEPKDDGCDRCNVTLDNATRQHLRQLIDEERRRKLKLATPVTHVVAGVPRGTCEHCGQSFPVDDRQPLKRFCSVKCRRDSAYARLRADPDAFAAHKEKKREWDRKWRKKARPRVRPAGVCKRGHLIEGWNVAPNSDGKRRCRTCINAYQRERKRRIRAERRAA